MIQEFEKTGFIDLQSGAGKNRIDSMSVEEKATAVQEMSRVLCNHAVHGEVSKHWTGL